MHRATPLNTSFRAYSAGGSRSVVDSVDDSKFMQEMAGGIMSQESRKAIECPQNYGFTSVVFDAEKDGNNKIGAEVTHNFLGGNRSYPVAGAMDDRRHRMFKLEKGDTAMFRGRGDYQQFHMSGDGGFWTAPQNKTVRMQLVQKDSESNATVQQGGQGSQGGGQPSGNVLDASGRVAVRDTGSGGNGTGGSQGGQQQQKKRGQEAIYKDGQKSPMFMEVTKDKTRMGGNTCHMVLSDGNTYVHCHTDKNVYVGAEAGKGSFDFLATLSGPCVNSKGKIG
jgi:phage gp45-like